MLRKDSPVIPCQTVKRSYDYSLARKWWWIPWCARRLTENLYPVGAFPTGLQFSSQLLCYIMCKEKKCSAFTVAPQLRYLRATSKRCTLLVCERNSLSGHTLTWPDMRFSSLTRILFLVHGLHDESTGPGLTVDRLALGPGLIMAGRGNWHMIVFILILDQ